MVAHFLVRRFDIHSAALRQQICVSSGEGSDARPTVEPCQAQSCKHAGVECRAKVGLRVLFYFLALGLGYLFVEIVLVQRLVFFLADPVYAVAVVLAGLLLVSGFGSAWAARQIRKGISAMRLACLAAIVVAVTGTVYAVGLHPLLTALLSWPLWARMVLAFTVILPFAAMGIPFPLLLLRQLGQTHAELLPRAWAINGCASVFAAPLATLLALGAGLPRVLLVASACYAVAALLAGTWQRGLVQE